VKQDTILSVLSHSLPDEGLCMMPMAENQSPDFEILQKEVEKQAAGNASAGIQTE